jgi:hypothetical protein
MKQIAESMPTANIAVNKSRLKMYNKKSDIPTFYLQKGQEFQIELFNSTTDTILAKISLNNNPIAQGGLVLRPGERVFLDRYLDVAKKFKFDTYEVANSKAAQKAIEENGDFKVEFYREEQPRPILKLNQPTRSYPWDPNHYPTYGGTFNNGGYAPNSLTNIGSSGQATMDMLGDVGSVATGQAASFNANLNLDTPKSAPIRKKRSKKSKSVETGRVEQGQNSDQKLQTIDKTFEYIAFHTIEYKLLPVSQKVNTTNDVKFKKHCVECGAKQKPKNKFCPKCGTKI